MSNFKWGRGSKKRMEGVNPLLVACATRVLLLSKYDLTVPWMGGVRTAAEQKGIFNEGNSKCDGYKVLSYHQIQEGEVYGNALDLIPVVGKYKNLRGLNQTANLMQQVWQQMIAEGVTQGYIMRWGGTFGRSGWDKPHYEIKKIS